MTLEELQLENERLFDNYMQQHSDIVTLKFEKLKMKMMAYMRIFVFWM